MMIRQYIYYKFQELVQYAYPEKLEYSRFFIDLEFKEKKACSFSYVFEKKKKIIINSLSREPSDLYIEIVYALAKHIDIIDRKETHIDFVYLCIVKKLLSCALSLNHITKQDLHISKNILMKSKLQENFGSFKNWEVKLTKHTDYVYIIVFQSEMIRVLLKSNGYSYDKDQMAWTKYVSWKKYQEEADFILLHNQKAIFKTLVDNTFYIKPAYCLRVNTYAIEDSILWKSFNYRYDPKKNVWYKNIYATELSEEIKIIASLPKQKMTISEIQFINK